jgi:hypothetical protein
MSSHFLILITMAHNDRFILEHIITLAEEEDYVQALQMNCMLSQSLQQKLGYRNTGGMGKLKGPKELVYGMYPAQLRMLR